MEKTKKFSKRLKIFTLFTTLALSIGIGVVLAPKDVAKVCAAEEYVLVTSSGDINTTDTYKLGYEYNSATYFYNGVVSSNSLNFVTTPTDAGNIKLEASDNGHYLKNGESYLNNTSGTNIALSTTAVSEWVFFYTSGDKDLPIANFSFGYRFLGRASTTGNTAKAYANSNPFSTYPPVYLYKIVEATFGTLTSIEVKEPVGAPTTFYVGDLFSYEGLVLIGHDGDGNTMTITEGFETDYDGKLFTSTAASITVTVTYLTFTDTYTIEVLSIPLAEQDLFFSEYVEGGSNNKYLEIFNPLTTAVNLSNYEVRLYANGASSHTTNLILPDVELAPFRTFVIGHTSAAIAGVTVDLANGGITGYNGDDALSIYNSVKEKNVDVFGQIGYDPGTQWGSGDEVTLDKTLVRKPHITRGDQVGDNAFVPSLEWISYPINTGTYLGDAANGAFVLAEYLMATNDADQCVTKYVVAKDHYYSALSPASVAEFKNGTAELLVSARARFAAWALNQNDDVPFLDTSSDKKVVKTNKQSIAGTIIILSAAIGLTTLGGFYFLKKRRYAR